ncbi:MAG: hypothetical protein Q4A84_10415 [Neisseria sp.]|uniref:hypothetical protein n=1 Tax=Neisseria sp. TaxID=192066 RepID=UPI0026DC74D1|nr:hypothetical protein [Neisseria sp.]MDO4642090.1 hypothetical protein [Neisseria sp.]
MKPFTSLLTAVLLSAASLSACGGSENRMSIQEQTEKRFQLNPHPTKAYRIKIKINDAPGPLKLMGDMDVGYLADNCSYIINKLEGATAKPEKDLQTKIQQIGQNEYETVIFLDAIQDEDYFGNGVCHWKPYGFSTLFKATGKLEETGFSIGDIIENLIEKRTITKYYWKGGYPYYKNDDGSIYDNSITDDGVLQQSLNMYTDEQRKNLFNVIISIEEIK